MKLVIPCVEFWEKQVPRPNWMYKNLLKITLKGGGKEPEEAGQNLHNASREGRKEGR